MMLAQMCHVREQELAILAATVERQKIALEREATVILQQLVRRTEHIAEQLAPCYERCRVMGNLHQYNLVHMKLSLLKKMIKDRIDVRSGSPALNLMQLSGTVLTEFQKLEQMMKEMAASSMKMAEAGN